MSNKQNKQLKLEIVALKEEVSFLEKRCERTEANYDQLIDQVKQLLRDRFGSKSERYIDPNNPQHSLLDDTNNEAGLAENSEETVDADDELDSNIVEIAAYKRRRKSRKDNVSNLPRRTVIIPVDDADRLCACGKCKEVIRYEISEILNYQPPVYEIIEEKREVVACPKGCTGSIQGAPAPKRVLPKVLASASFLSQVIVSKVDDRQPLYHQEKQYDKRYQFYLSRQTLSHYMISCASILQPIYNLAKDVLIDYDVASSDATTLQVLQEPGRPAKLKSYVYCMRGGPPDKSVILYDYNALNHKQYVSDWFEGFKGYLHVDADPFFEQLGDSDNVTLSYCNTHARRKFEPIAQAAKSDGLAKYAMKVYQALYKIEKKAKIQKLTPEQRYTLRQAASKPIMDDYKKWLDEVYPTVLAKSPLGKAIKYCLNHWSGMIQFLNDGRLEIDNNLTEQEIKPFVIGRKNFLFACSIAGAKALCVHFSLVRMAKAQGLDPYRYYVKALEALPHCKGVEDYEKLLPWNIDLGEAHATEKAA